MYIIDIYNVIFVHQKNRKPHQFQSDKASSLNLNFSLIDQNILAHSCSVNRLFLFWIPACAGMTRKNEAFNGIRHSCASGNPERFV